MKCYGIVILVVWCLRGVESRRKRKEQDKKEHGLEIAEWVRNRAVVENAQAKEKNETSRFAGLYECPHPGEAYSAAYLTTKTQFLKPEVAVTRLHKGQGNMEGASNAVFRRSTLYKTVDLLDFFIVHLSWYERRMQNTLNDQVARRIRAQKAHIKKKTSLPPENSKVIVVMPFYATPGGDSGHSQLEMRRLYLNLTIDSLRNTFPYIAVAVGTEFDFRFCQNTSLPIFDIMLRTDIVRPSRLGLAAVYMTQQKLQHDPKWSHFEYVFYTESDQLLHFRDLSYLFHIVDHNQHPRYGSFLIPHRIMPAPRRVDMGPDSIKHADIGYGVSPEKYTTSLTNIANADAKLLSWTDSSFLSSSCCFDRAPCRENRDHWRSFESSQIELFRITSDDASSSTKYDETDFQHSLALVAGEGNFIRSHFRPCSFSAHRREFC